MTGGFLNIFAGGLPVFWHTYYTMSIIIMSVEVNFFQALLIIQVDLWLVKMGITTNQKPTLYRNLHENTAS